MRLKLSLIHKNIIALLVVVFVGCALSGILMYLELSVPFASGVVNSLNCVFGALAFSLIYLIIKNRKSISAQRAIQFFWAFLIPALFWNIAVISPYTNKENIYIIIFGTIIVNAFMTSLLYVYYSNREKIRVSVYRDFGVMAIIAVFVILLLLDLDGIPQWDSGWFYNELTKGAAGFAFSYESFFMPFQWFGHTTILFSLYYAIPAFLFPGNYVVVNIFNIMLSAFGIYCFNYVVKKIFFKENKSPDKWQNAEVLLLTACYAFSPMVLGLTPLFDIDSPLIPLFFIFIYFYIKQQNILALFFAMQLISCKETGIMLYFGFYFALFMSEFLKNKDMLFKRVWTSFIDTKVYTVPMFAFLGLFILRGGMLWFGGVGSSGPHGLFKDFLNNLVSRLFQCFSANFMWIFTLIILIGIVFAVLKKRKPEMDRLSWMMISAFSFHTVFYFVYSTVQNYRYLTVSAIFLFIFAYASLKIFFKSHLPRVLTLAVMFVLLFVQSYYTIDPSMLLTKRNFMFGNHKMVAFADNGDDTYYSDSIVYNRQYANLSRLYTKMCFDLELTPEDTIMFLRRNQWDVGFNGEPGIYEIFYDENLGRTHLKNNTPIKVDYYNGTDIVFKDRKDLPQLIYLVKLCWDVESDFEGFCEKYVILNEFKIEENGYWLYVYESELR